MNASPQGDATRSTRTQDVLALFASRGGSQYGGECVSQLEHALQAAWFAEREGASASLVSAALLHDLGHLLHGLSEDAPSQGVDDLHEELAARWLADRFGPAVCEPVRLHVVAKRYLCAVEPDYWGRLSAPSQRSLRLQGGPMNAREVEDFNRAPFAAEAVRLRRWDDAAKVAGLQTPALAHFAQYLDSAD